ncbi:MAG TPA: hypothetical protein VMM38_01295 [Aridibacter sp.]|nr:hypothetical protein [Aridibacter sp.]
MANEIHSKLAASAGLTITLASLASSAAGVGRQSTLVDNSSTLYKKIHLYVTILTGTSPTANKAVYVYLIKGDGTIRTDGAGATDAAITIKNAQLIGALVTDATSDNPYSDCFIIEDPGPEWGIAVVHDTGVNLNASGHDINWVGQLPEVQ